MHCLMLAVDFVKQISSTSPSGGNLVDGLPPASSLAELYESFSSTDGRMPKERRLAAGGKPSTRFPLE